MKRQIIKLTLDVYELAKVLQIEVGKPFPAYFGKFDDYFAGLVILQDDGKMYAVASCTVRHHFRKFDCPWFVGDDNMIEIVAQRMEA